MKKLAQFKRKILGGPGGRKRVLWSPDDVERLQKIYGVTDKEVDEVLKRLPSTDTPIVPKSEMPADAPTKWRFVASDGKVDRDNDVVRVEGINLKDYLANPLWTYMHNFDRPIGMGPDTSRQGSKLYSTLELGLDSFVDAVPVQRMLVNGMLKACSISFRPTVWKYVEERDGINFDEVDLWEIAAVTFPACPGAVLLGPVKSFQQRAAELRKVAAADLAYVARATQLHKQELAWEHEKKTTTFDERMRARRRKAQAYSQGGRSC